MNTIPKPLPLQESLTRTFTYDPSRTNLNLGPYLGLQPVYKNGRICVVATTQLDTCYINLHQKKDVPPTHIRLDMRKKYDHKVTKLSDTIFDLMTIAHEKKLITKSLLQFGAGNQVSDLFGTVGESAYRVEAMRHQELTHKPETPIIAATYQAGNCREFAQVAFSQVCNDPKLTHVPKQLVRLESINTDHMFVLLGDPRIKQYGENSVVLDAWPIMDPTHTLAQNYYYKQGALLKHLNSYQTFCNNPDLNRFEEELTDRTVVTLWPAPSKDRLINLIKNEKDSTLLCQKWTSSLDTSTTYISDSHPLGNLRLSPQ